MFSTQHCRQSPAFIEIVWEEASPIAFCSVRLGSSSTVETGPLCTFCTHCVTARADNACPSTLLALTAQSPVLKDACPSTLLAPIAPPPMLTDAAAATLLAPTALSPMLTNTCPSALLAPTAPLPVLTDA